MSQSTSIRSLPPPNEEQDPQTKQMVQNILNEIRVEDQKYTGGQPMQQQMQMQQPMQQQPMQQNMMGSYPDQGQMMPMSAGPDSYQQPAGHQYMREQYEDRGEMNQGGYEMSRPRMQMRSKKRVRFADEPVSLSSKLIAEAKDPMVVATIFVIMNTPIVVNMLSHYLPLMLNRETGNPTYVGLLIRAIVVGIIYYLIKKFILSKQ